MSTKVRYIYRSRFGDWYLGGAAAQMIELHATKAGLVLPPNIAKEKARWQKLIWLFEHMAGNDLAAFAVYREPARLPRRLSTYRQAIAPLRMTAERLPQLKLVRLQARLAAQRANRQRPPVPPQRGAVGQGQAPGRLFFRNIPAVNREDVWADLLRPVQVAPDGQPNIEEQPPIRWDPEEI